MTPAHSEMVEYLRSSSKDRQNQAFTALTQSTKSRIAADYDLWEELFRLLSDGDNRQRAIASQVLCNLAQTDPEERILAEFGTLLAITRDKHFVTARHCLQSLWKVALAGERQRRMVVTGLVKRFHESAKEKHCTLIRYDILEVLKRIYDATGETSLRTTADSLILLEADLKYRAKYQKLWRSSS